MKIIKVIEKILKFISGIKYDTFNDYIIFKDYNFKVEVYPSPNDYFIFYIHYNEEKPT